jgi:integrase
MEERGALDIARRVNQRCWYVLDYAKDKKWRKDSHNPATGRTKSLKKIKKKHRPHLSAKDVPAFLRELDNYRGSKKVKLAMELLWLTMVRPGEVRQARWPEFDRKEAMWRIPAERMKMGRPHLVPLSRQALRVLDELEKITGNCEFLFPSERNTAKPISDVTLLKVLIILGYDGKDEKKPKYVPHGTRGTASTILNETRINGVRKFDADIIERQLAHVEANSTRASYNHAEYLEQRAEMLQWWADYLDDARKKK